MRVPQEPFFRSIPRWSLSRVGLATATLPVASLTSAHHEERHPGIRRELPNYILAQKSWLGNDLSRLLVVFRGFFCETLVFGSYLRLIQAVIQFGKSAMQFRFVGRSGQGSFQVDKSLLEFAHLEQDVPPSIEVSLHFRSLFHGQIGEPQCPIQFIGRRSIQQPGEIVSDGWNLGTGKIGLLPVETGFLGQAAIPGVGARAK